MWFCDYNDAYILVRDDITVTAAGVTQVTYKNCAPLTKSITKIDGTTIDDAEDLDLVMAIYNLIDYSSNCCEALGNLWFYSKDEAISFNGDIENTNKFISFKYKAELLGNKVVDGANDILKNVITAVPLKYLNDFWKSVEMPLINCKVELKPKWTKCCGVSAAGNENVIIDNNNATGT